MALLLRRINNVEISPAKVLRHRYATQMVDRQTLYYEEIGHGPKSVLLLPGALGSSRTDFSPILPKFNKEKFTVIAWDPPGYGKSRPPNRTWPARFFDRDATMAVKLMMQLNRPSFSCVGWSDGGNTALVAAILHPDVVNRIIVWGANSVITDDDLKLYENIKTPEQWSQRMRAPFEADLGADYFRETLAAWCLAMKNYPDGDVCRSRLSEIRCPTLVMHGDLDALVPSFQPDLLEKNIPNLKRIDFPGGKHNFHMKFADAFMQEVDNFLD